MGETIVVGETGQQLSPFAQKEYMRADLSNCSRTVGVTVKAFV